MTKNKKYIDRIPPSGEHRGQMAKRVKFLVGDESCVAPLSMSDLESLAQKYIAQNPADAPYRDWIMVQINNSVWGSVVASIPHQRRMLLMPKCLSNSSVCTAEIDDFGLLCNQCGGCSINMLQNIADGCGVMSVVAEGFTSVVPLVESGQVEAVIGVGCLESLERAFPLLIGNAVPAIAIALNCDGCKDTQVDQEAVAQAIRVVQDTERQPHSLDGLKDTVNDWFSMATLKEMFGKPDNHASQVAMEWLGGEGKRWRPYMLASVYSAISKQRDMPAQVQRAAVAVECFHKASLIHDDIEDSDMYRYGQQTINSLHGNAIAINVGDMLLGMGYGLLAECGSMEMMKIASVAHIDLCKGQGEELNWGRAGESSLSMEKVIDIFAHKTVPAFAVAIDLGAICAGAEDTLKRLLSRYSIALGIAYQLNDDLDDALDSKQATTPSAIVAALSELSGGLGILAAAQNEETFGRAKSVVEQLAARYREEAIGSLSEIRDVDIKSLLFRVTERILKKN